MTKNIKYGILILSALVFMFSSCKKTETTTTTPTYGNFSLTFKHVYGMTEIPFKFDTLLVHPMTGDSLTFTKFRYYVSNIKIKKDDGSWWNESNSYHIVDASVASSLTINFSNIPSGNYTDLEYTLGVDSLHNVSGAQDGALSVTEGMFWNWNSGYIMLKAEGTAPNASGNVFQFHLGGFSGTNNIVTVKSTNFSGTSMVIASDKTPQVQLKANVAKLWHSSPSVSITNIIHMPGTGAKTMADDFYGSFAFDSLNQ